ncbi:alpha/beta hydrolase family protein [Adhaeribacter terreus]|uniref:Alpha/beta hydrolase family protein n=1 Tax=Adhaeribacter terreus TaxID=529703 RepID=A0ABW0EA27_9BACT
MAPLHKHSLVLHPPHGRRYSADARFLSDGKPKPVVVFVHGFKGFKDWGCWNLVADTFAGQGFAFIKMNFSHNGTSPEDDSDLHDLEAFGNNNFSLEMEDVDTLLNFLESDACSFRNELDLDKTGIIGHSRGGGLVLLKAAEDVRIKAVTTWASVCDMNPGWGEDILKKWEAEGVLYNLNGRTNVQMPLKYQLYEDYVANGDRYNVSLAASKLQQPLLIVHGSEDEVLPLACAEQLHREQPNSELFVVENADHSFGACHPYDKPEMPADLQKVVAKTIAFFRENI